MEHTDTFTAVGQFVALLAAATLVALLARRIALPFTVGLVVVGLVAEFVAPQAQLEISPDLVLAVLLPGLIFDAAYRMRISVLRRTFGGVVLLAVPGVLLSAGIVAVVLHYLAGLPFNLAFVVGAMVSATDPAAVVATFRRLKTPERLATLIDGESLFNDGTALVVFLIALKTVGADFSIGDAAMTFLATVALSVLIGAVAGLLATAILSRVEDHLIEVTVALITAYGTYLLADLFHESGIIATVVAGVTLGNLGRRFGISERAEGVIDTVFEVVAFLLTALVFLLVGLAIHVVELGAALGPIAWGVFGVVAGRLIVVYGLLGGSARLGRKIRLGSGLPTSWLHMMFWGGLRGAVAVAMALSLPLGFPQRALLQEITFGVVLFTLVVQGATTELVLNWTGAGREDGEPVARAEPDPVSREEPEAGPEDRPPTV